MVDEQLGAAAEEVRQRGGAVLRLEPVVLARSGTQGSSCRWRASSSLRRVSCFSASSSSSRAASHSSRVPVLWWVIVLRSFIIVGVRPGIAAGAATKTTPRATIASASGTSTAARTGSSFWARTRAAMTPIHATLMTPTAARTAMSPTLEPRQQSPSAHPDLTPSRQRRRHARLSGVSSYGPAAIVRAPAAAVPVRPVQRVHGQADRGPDGEVGAGERQRGGARPSARARPTTAGVAPGSIIAAIIGTHAAAKDPSEPSSVATPMSMPSICRTATSQDAAASPRVAASTAPGPAVPGRLAAAVRRSTAISSPPPPGASSARAGPWAAARRVLGQGLAGLEQRLEVREHARPALADQRARRGCPARGRRGRP